MNKTPCFCVFAAFILVVVLATLSPATVGQQITNLPGYHGPNLTMFSGYIDVDPSHGRFLFYWLIESQSDPQNDPLVLWLNGGPGCSSLGGLFSENGPIQPDGSGGAMYTDISWTNVANVLYLEAPAGVGFSYSNTPSDYNTNDAKTAADNYVFLQLFMQQYPQYQGRDLWITGESYAGVYIPTLSALILGNDSSPLFHQFTGIMAGNPVFNCKEQSTAIQFNLLYWHGLVSYTHYQSWMQRDCNNKEFSIACDLIYSETLAEIGEIDQQLVITRPGLEGRASNRVSSQIMTHNKPSPNLFNFPSVDPDDLYQDFCTGNGTLEYADNRRPFCDPNGNLVSNYLNRADVQKAIHAQPTKWTECTNQINYQASGDNMVLLYNMFFITKPSLKVLIYSGDVDIMTVPFAITDPCVAQMNGSLVSEWQPWFVNGATAGYVEVFQTHTRCTVKGAGHEVPEYQPLTALNMFTRFLQNGNLDEDIQSRSHRQQRTRLMNNILTQGKMLRLKNVRP